MTAKAITILCAGCGHVHRAKDQSDPYDHHGSQEAEDAMLTFKNGCDPDSMHIERGDGRWLGFLQWHKDRPPRVSMLQADYLTIDELREIVVKFDEVKP